MAISFHMGPGRETWREGGSFARDLERRLKERSGNGEALSLWELCKGNVERGLLYGGL
jgi:hypothetical protein